MYVSVLLTKTHSRNFCYVHVSKLLFKLYARKEPQDISFLIATRQKKEKDNGSKKKCLVKNDQVSECQSGLPRRRFILTEVDQKIA